MKVKQHIPGFVSGIDPECHEINSGAELEALEFVKRWRGGPGFYRFAIDRNYWANPERTEQMHLLLAQFEEGYRWWVVAYLSGPDALEVVKEFPEWEAKERDGQDSSS